MPESFITTFWQRIDKTANGCWMWRGTSHRNGYGDLRINGRRLTVPRMAWRLLHGEIPDGQEVMHSCDNPACVNPDHLSLGTHLENMRDMAHKGRASPRHGALNPNAHITEQDAVDIRNSTKPVRELMRLYKLTHGQIYRIRNWKAWAHAR